MCVQNLRVIYAFLHIFFRKFVYIVNVNSNNITFILDLLL